MLDVSGAALARVRDRLGPAAEGVRWIEADVTGEWAVEPVDIWHDRAVFHFLTGSSDRDRYMYRLREAVRPNGHVILATFALTGPQMCSGLEVMRHSADTLAAALGREFRLVRSFDEHHATPRGVTQAFCWTLFKRTAAAGEERS